MPGVAARAQGSAKAAQPASSGEKLPDGTVPEAIQQFAGPGKIEGLTRSIEGLVLVLGLPEARQWVFLRPGGRGRLDVIGRIPSQFAGGGRAGDATAAFPRPAGWCYAEPRDVRPFPPCSSGAAPVLGP